MQTRMMWTLVFAVAVVTAACGDSKSSLLPTAPSALSTESANVDAGAAGVTSGLMHHRSGHSGGPGNGNGNGNGNNPRTPTNTSPTPTAPVPPGKSKVEFEGLIQEVNATFIKVNGQRVNLTAETVIRHGNRRFEVSDLHRDDRVHVRANRVAAPAGAVGSAADTTLEAEEIKLQNPGDSGDGTTGATDVLVSVLPLDASALERTATGVVDPGTFQLTRTGTATQLALPLTVSFTLGGTAVAGDYVAIAATASFPANQATIDVLVTPVADSAVEPAESVVLTLTAGTGYELGSPFTATVMIADAPPPQVSLRVPDPFAAEIANNGRFEVLRSGNLAAPLTVRLEFSGTALLGSDYLAIPAPSTPPVLTYTFAPGEDRVTIWVEPIDDGLGETVAETVVLRVIDGADYDLGTAAVGTVTIAAR